MRVVQKRITNEKGRIQAHNSQTNGSPKSRRFVPIAWDMSINGDWWLQVKACA
jgi:hypothetical protein